MVTLAIRPEPALEAPSAAPLEVQVCAGDPWAGSYSPDYGGGRRQRQQPAAARKRRPGSVSGVDPGAAGASLRRPRGEGTAGSRKARKEAVAPHDRDRPVRHRLGRVAYRVVTSGAAALALALLLAISLPVLFGCRSLVVMSGSMEPGIGTGSVVVVKRIPAAEIAVGDVVSFHSPESGRILTHRVQALAVGEGVIEVQTRGDANTGSESWAIEPTGAVGRLVFEIPYLGYALAPLQGVAPRLLLVVMPALALGGILLASIWREPARTAPKPSGRRRRVRRALRPARSEGT